MATFNQANYVRMPVDQLKVGMLLRSPIFDDGDETPVLLVAAGKQLSPQQLEKIRGRGISHVQVGLADIRSGRAGKLAQIRRDQEKREQAESDRSRWSNGRQPFLKLAAKNCSNPRQSEQAEKFSAQFAQSIEDIGTLYLELADGRDVSGETIGTMTSSCLREIREDVDLFVTLGLVPDASKYPITHGIQTARLAMAIGAVLGMDEESLLHLGAGCLLHDIGMLHVSPEILNCGRPLTKLEWLEVQKHPTRAVDLLLKVEGLALSSRMVAYQMHERLDGSGYPRRRPAILIHPCAKIAMVADTYVAMTSPRPHRPAAPPYRAMVEVLDLVRQGKFDGDAVTGLLDVLSMFPLGSKVALDNGEIATVIRANPGQYVRPIVEVTVDWEVETIDLLQREDLNIVRAVLDE
jgi:HD-GYP domain-containing protein (c-di-GMP phosphodiesterase class II)